MRLAIIVLLTLATLPLALPPATAAHQGACWHEYAEGAAWAIGQSSPLKAYGAVVASCNERAKDQACYILVGNDECVAS